MNKTFSWWVPAYDFTWLFLLWQAMLCMVNGSVFLRLTFSIPEYHKKENKSPRKNDFWIICTCTATGDFLSVKDNQHIKTSVQESPCQLDLTQLKIYCISIGRYFSLSSWINYTLESVWLIQQNYFCSLRIQLKKVIACMI